MSVEQPKMQRENVQHQLETALTNTKELGTTMTNAIDKYKDELSDKLYLELCSLRYLLVMIYNVLLAAVVKRHGSAFLPHIACKKPAVVKPVWPVPMLHDQHC